MFEKEYGLLMFGDVEGVCDNQGSPVTANN